MLGRHIFFQLRDDFAQHFLRLFLRRARAEQGSR